MLVPFTEMEKTKEQIWVQGLKLCGTHGSFYTPYGTSHCVCLLPPSDSSLEPAQGQGLCLMVPYGLVSRTWTLYNQ